MANLFLIDLSSLAHPIWHVTDSQRDTNPNACSEQTLARVRALASGQPHVAICCDSGRSFRRDIDPTYKANRKESDAALQHQIALVRDQLAADGFPVWAAAGFEADDLIATAATAALKDDGSTVQIASADKDLLQLVSERVTIKSLRDGSTVDAAAVVAKFGVQPHQIRDFLSLVGDASDNIKGAEYIGEKKAVALLATFGNLDDCYAALDKGEAAIPPAQRASLEAFRPRLETVRALITLRTDAPIPFADVWRERVPADVAVFAGEEDSMADAPMSEEPQVPLPEVVASGAPPVATPQDVTPRPGAPTQQALAVRPADFALADGPTTYAQAKLMAADLYAAKLFNGYGSPAAVLSTIILGRELGLSVGAALRGFHIVEAKHLMHADLIRARAKASPVCEYFRCTERTNEAATFVTKCKDDPEPVSLRFTVEDGRRAWPKRAKDGSGVDEPSFLASGWGKNPADMCVARASSKLARLVYPEAVHGFYAPEEMD